MVSPKSILRSGSSSRGINKFRFSFENEDDASIPKVLPPSMRPKTSIPVEEEVNAMMKHLKDGIQGLLSPSAVNAQNDETRTDDDVNERALESEDDKIDMSVAFDDKLDEISMIHTFEYLASLEDDLPMERSIEVTYENYLEFEAMRKESLQETMDDVEVVDTECEELHCLSGHASTVATEIEHFVDLEELNQSEIAIMKNQVEQIKAALIQRRSEHARLENSLEKLLEDSLKLVDQALLSQKKIESDFALNTVKYTEWQSKYDEKNPLRVDDPSDVNIMVPPPVDCGMETVHDADEVWTKTSSVVEDVSPKANQGDSPMETYKNDAIMVPSADKCPEPEWTIQSDAVLTSENNMEAIVRKGSIEDDTSEILVMTLSRVETARGPPRGTFGRAWLDMMHLAEELRLTFTEDLPMDVCSSIKCESGFDNEFGNLELLKKEIEDASEIRKIGDGLQKEKRALMKK